MSLLTSIRHGVDATFKALESLQTTVYYQSAQQGSYDPATGSTGLTYREVEVAGFLVRYKQEEITANEALKPGDYKFIIQQSTLYDDDFIIPKTADRIFIKDKYWNIIYLRQDPIQATWIVGIRIGHP
jgi:hypothetical protein